jgi:hypothetical protein
VLDGRKPFSSWIQDILSTKSIHEGLRSPRLQICRVVEVSNCTEKIKRAFSGTFLLIWHAANGRISLFGVTAVVHAWGVTSMRFCVLGPNVGVPRKRNAIKENMTIAPRAVLYFRCRNACGQKLAMA